MVTLYEKDVGFLLLALSVSPSLKSSHVFPLLPPSHYGTSTGSRGKIGHSKRGHRYDHSEAVSEDHQAHRTRRVGLF